MMSSQARSTAASDSTNERPVDPRQAYLRRVFGLVGPTSALIASILWGDRE